MKAINLTVTFLLRVTLIESSLYYPITLVYYFVSSCWYVLQERDSMMFDKEELEHDLESKNHTIKMLQMQLVSNEFKLIRTVEPIHRTSMQRICRYEE